MIKHWLIIRIDVIRDSRIIPFMQTVIETPTFQKQADKLWGGKKIGCPLSVGLRTIHRRVM
jgi:hypothetical protein